MVISSVKSETCIILEVVRLGTQPSLITLILMRKIARIYVISIIVTLFRNTSSTQTGSLLYSIKVIQFLAYHNRLVLIRLTLLMVSTLIFTLTERRFCGVEANSILITFTMTERRSWKEEPKSP